MLTTVRKTMLAGPRSLSDGALPTYPCLTVFTTDFSRFEVQLRCSVRDPAEETAFWRFTLAPGFTWSQLSSSIPYCCQLFLTVVRSKKNYYWYCIPLGRLWLGATTKRPPSQRDANKLEGKWNVRTSKKPSKQTCVPYVTQAPSPQKVAQLGSHRSTGLTNLGFSGENKGRYFLPYSSDSLPYSQSSSNIYSPRLQLPCKGVLIHSPILLGRSP